jgi:hypothetical protein
MILTATVMAAHFWAGCSKVNEFLEQAPLKDGLYLSYETGESTWITVEFSKAGSDQYYATSTNEYEDEETSEIISSSANRVLVDQRLKKENGYPYDADNLGPLWTPASSIKQGGAIHGTYIDGIKKWKSWNVAVIKASFGRGAITGTWYYDQKTGFLVGGQMATVMDEKGESFELYDTNLDDLIPQTE